MKYILIFLLILAPMAVFAQGADENEYNGGGNAVDVQVSGNAVDDYGGGNTGGSAVEITNPLGDLTIQGFFQAIIDILMVFAIPLIVFFIVYAGFLYVTARGNVETIQQAHRALLYALIGGLIIIGANVLIDVISGTVDVVTG